MTKRDLKLQHIVNLGYHEQYTEALLYAIENRIGIEATKQYYHKGYQAKLQGIRCNCPSCINAIASLDRIGANLCHTHKP